MIFCLHTPKWIALMCYKPALASYHWLKKRKVLIFFTNVSILSISMISFLFCVCLFKQKQFSVAFLGDTYLPASLVDDTFSVVYSIFASKIRSCHKPPLCRWRFCPVNDKGGTLRTALYLVLRILRENMPTANTVEFARRIRSTVDFPSKNLVRTKSMAFTGKKK